MCKRHPITGQPKSLQRIGLKSEAEAKRVQRELVGQIERSFQETVMPTWTKLTTEYMQSKRNTDWSEKTFENCKLCLEAHTYDLWKGCRVDSITTQQIRELITKTLGDQSASHKKTMLKFVRGSFQYAVDTGILRTNPTPDLKIRLGDKIKKVLTAEQSKVLLTQARDSGSEWYYHWALALYTGMRNGELYALTWDKVNFENRTIKVDSSWNNTDGFKETKSGDDRLVEIAPNLVVILKELRLQNPEPNFVLPRSRHWDKGEQARCLRMFLMGIGLPPIRFHDLRATWATILLSKGVPAAIVMSMGGWKDLKTMQIYIRKAGMDIRGSTEGLDLHDPVSAPGKVLKLFGGSDE